MCLYTVCAHRHKQEGSEEQAGPIGSIRVNGSQIQSKVDHVGVSLTQFTTVEEVLKNAVKQFGLQVSGNSNYSQACYVW